MPSQGSQWTILAENFVKYVLHDERAKRWLNAFERRLVPDESLLQTIMMHSPFKQSLINHNLRWIYWPHQATTTRTTTTSDCAAARSLSSRVRVPGRRPVRVLGEGR